MDFKQYQAEACKNLKQHDSEKDEVCDYMIGLLEEAGEVASIIKHHFWSTKEVNLEELAEELGDVLWYSVALCKVYGLDLETIAKINVAKSDYRYGTKDFKDSHNVDSFKETGYYKLLASQLYTDSSVRKE